jgi:hypothetical protein
MYKVRFLNWILSAAMLVLLAFAPLTVAQGSGFSQVDNIGLGAGGPTRGDCFSAAHHAASDCDRLASVSPASIQPAGLTTGNCYSDAYHAASDCDRLALASQVLAQSSAPTASDCFSSAHHAASDCDRLVSNLNISTIAAASH